MSEYRGVDEMRQRYGDIPTMLFFVICGIAALAYGQRVAALMGLLVVIVLAWLHYRRA
jgi:hypothetical protein